MNSGMYLMYSESEDFLVQSESFVRADWRQMVLFQEHLNPID